jgi:hypothetical protein
MRESDADFVTIEGRHPRTDRNADLVRFALAEKHQVDGNQNSARANQVHGNYGPWHNTYLALYFTLTGLHALHILGGSIVIGYLWGPGRRMWKTDPERFTNRIEVSGLFWHFVDLVWIFLFPGPIFNLMNL